MNIGEYLRVKTSNFFRWLNANGAEVENLDCISNIALTSIAELLRLKYQDAIDTADFSRLLDDELPEEITAAVKFVQQRPEMHDKFWRYLELFSDTVACDVGPTQPRGPK